MSDTKTEVSAAFLSALAQQAIFLGQQPYSSRTTTPAFEMFASLNTVAKEVGAQLGKAWNWETAGPLEEIVNLMFLFGKTAESTEKLSREKKDAVKSVVKYWENFFNWHNVKIKPYSELKI